MHVFFHAIEEGEKKNAKKSIPENVFCFCDRCYYGSCVCVLQLVCCEWAEKLGQCPRNVNERKKLRQCPRKRKTADDRQRRKECAGFLPLFIFQDPIFYLTFYGEMLMLMVE